MVTITPSYVEVIEFYPFNVTCEVTGLDVPVNISYQWYKSDFPTEIIASSQVFLSYPLRYDSGTYTCQAQSINPGVPTWRKTGTVQLKVKC